MELYGLEGYEIRLINAHEGGRNVAYNCDKADSEAKIIRIAFLSDRSREDILGEVEYIRYLYEHGGSVSNVVNSQKGNLLETITLNNHTFFVCLFVKAKGVCSWKIIISIGKAFLLRNTIITAVKSLEKCINYRRDIRLSILGMIF